MNVIVVMVDTLRYDYVSFHGVAPAAAPAFSTPNFDRFCADAWVFDRYFTASYPTIPHRTDVLTGEYGAPLHTWQPLDHGRITLPRVLAHHGYLTQLIHDSPHLVNGGHNFDYPFHYWTQIRGAEVDRPWPAVPASMAQGEAPLLSNWAADPLFDEPAASLGAPLPPMHYAYAGANVGREALEDWNCARLFSTVNRFCREQAANERFFLWVDCFDPHEPWDVPAQIMATYDPRPDADGSIDPRSFYVSNEPTMSAEAQAVVVAQYAAKTAWVDRQLGTLLDTLAETGLDRNTAVVLASDHGTNVGGADGRFGKTTPVREAEAHIVLAVRVPDGGSGRSVALAQPQDLWATIAGIVGVPSRPDIESHDLLALARAGAASPRELAIAGVAADKWWGARNFVTGGQAGPIAGRDAASRRVLFTAIDGQWLLEVALADEDCRLTRLGGHQNRAAEHPERVQQMRAAGIDELERRGAHPDLLAWLRSGGTRAFPHRGPLHTGYPPPANYEPYFMRLYGR